MGLNCSHNAWDGAYSAFMRWRKEIARAAGLPPLELMEGFYDPLKSNNVPTLYHGIDTKQPAYGPDSEPYFSDLDRRLPIRWDCLKPNPLHELLYHSDCGGEIEAGKCGPIADALEPLIQLLPEGVAGGHIGNWKDKTATFVSGLRAAYAAGEPLDFH